ncbi:SCO family protein [Desulfogranum mediterraneum]|uniref:SCO family protein n=1 Tax=Desulfogranum mediterraneum TaxID=160661 RepID=UPI00048BAFF8|nr:SCO family protein [Desulfogranum mediterraneum]
MHPRNTLQPSLLLMLCLLLALPACRRQPPPLPILGSVQLDFALQDQDGQTVTPATFQDSIYVTDFFFTTCPTICPIMKSQMVRVYEAFRNQPRVLLLSHTIDPEHDTVSVLQSYAQGLEIDASRWHLVTGPKRAIYGLAKHYMLGVVESPQAPGGYLHSGSFCLIDRHRRIRGYYDGTDGAEVDRLIADIRRLLEEP